MTFTIAASLLITLVFLVWLIISIIRAEVRATDFWWKLLLAFAVLFTYGVHSFNG